MMNRPRTESAAWWRGAVVYQIWPRSFADGDGDGIGDLTGVISRLDHLNDGMGGGLGVDAVWLSPIYPSPLADFGYDISDHTAIDPTFGSLDAFDRLLDEVHGRSMRLLLDLVPNHTSVEHPWFVESRSATTSPKRDWYVWRDPVDGGPPNDWWSAFASVGSAWTFDAITGQYYLHSYTPDQPDLNWDNPEVRDAIKDVMRHWLDRGVDGFRIDVVHRLAKDPLLRSNPTGTIGLEPQGRGRHDADWSTIDSRLADLRSVADEYSGVLLVGEAYVVDQERMIEYLGERRLHLAHNFEFLHAPWSADGIGSVIARFEHMADGGSDGAWCLGNHDHRRIRSRFADTGHAEALTRAAAVLLMSLRGAVFVYQGDELGLPDTDLGAIEPLDVNGRDPVRTPIPWEPHSVAGPGAGFTVGVPWLPIERDSERFSVATQVEDPDSMLQLYRTVIRLRRASDALRIGSFTLRHLEDELLVFDRSYDRQTVRVIAGFSEDTRPLPPTLAGFPGRLLVSSADVEDATEPLRPYEVRWIELPPTDG